jgi:hypothetical protein
MQHLRTGGKRLSSVQVGKVPPGGREAGQNAQLTTVRSFGNLRNTGER